MSIDKYNRPEIISAETWFHDTEDMTASVFYTDIDGISPVLTNYFSSMNIVVVGGSGWLANEGEQHRLSTGTEVGILRATAYQYAGKLSLLTTAEPVLIPDLVTHNHEPLPKYAMKIIDNCNTINRIESLAESLKERMFNIMKLDEAFSRFQSDISRDRQS